MSVSYGGYRIIINGTTVYDGMIFKGSFKATPIKRIVGTWKDANLVDHDEILPTRKMDITFSVRKRTLDEHDAIKGIFALEESVPVTYWDDKTCTYKTGTFKMDAPPFIHDNTKDGTITYGPTQVHLQEY